MNAKKIFFEKRHLATRFLFTIITILFSSLSVNIAFAADSKPVNTKFNIFSKSCTINNGELFKSAKIAEISTILTGSKFVVMVTLENDKTLDGLFYEDPMTKTMSKLMEDAFLLGTRIDVCLQGYSVITGAGKTYNIIGAHSKNK